MGSQSYVMIGWIVPSYKKLTKLANLLIKKEDVKERYEIFIQDDPEVEAWEDFISEEIAYGIEINDWDGGGLILNSKACPNGNYCFGVCLENEVKFNDPLISFMKNLGKKLKLGTPSILFDFFII